MPLYYTYLVDFRAITNPVPVGADVFVDVESRRTAGASAMVVYQPYPLKFGHAAEIGATGTGV